MKKVIWFLLLMGVVGVRGLFAQANSSTHELIIILPELAKLNIEKNINQNEEEMGSISLNYEGAVMQVDDFNKRRNLQIEVLPNQILADGQFLQISYSDALNDLGMLPTNELIGTSHPLDLVLTPLHSGAGMQKSEVNFSYKLAEESTLIKTSGALEVVYTLSDI